MKNVFVSIFSNRYDRIAFYPQKIRAHENPHSRNYQLGNMVKRICKRVTTSSTLRVWLTLPRSTPPARSKVNKQMDDRTAELSE